VARSGGAHFALIDWMLCAKFTTWLERIVCWLRERPAGPPIQMSPPEWLAKWSRGGNNGHNDYVTPLWEPLRAQVALLRPSRKSERPNGAEAKGLAGNCHSALSSLLQRRRAAACIRPRMSLNQAELSPNSNGGDQIDLSSYKQSVAIID